MKELHAKLIDPIIFEPKEGQCDGFACSNKESITHCPSFGVQKSKELRQKKIDFLEPFCRNIIKLEIEKLLNEQSKKTI